MLTIEKVISSFNKIRYYFIKELNKCDEFKNFSPNEISILLALDNNPNIKTASDLCLALSVSKALISRSVDSLITKELIITSKSQEDKRVISLYLTDSGQEVASKMFDKMGDINRQISLNFNQSELELVDKTFKKIINYFEKMEGSKR